MCSRDDLGPSGVHKNAYDFEWQKMSRKDHTHKSF